ncbi:MAG: sugar ABC transporter permease [Provencibacterium sp.]|jgi:putative aldouronate transport system permease protein|nr:sugar ABC transporter permease [Provencibacterium sp.]
MLQTSAQKAEGSRPAVSVKRRGSFGKYLRNEYDLYLMLVPMLLFYLLFAYKPMTGLLIAFKDYSPFKGIWDSKWVGFQYFTEFFTGPYAWRVIRNTLTISLSTLVFGFPAPILLAVLLNELRARKFQKAVQTISYIPHFISTVVVCSMLTSFLSPTSGVVNAILQFFGREPVYFLSKPEMFVPIYLLMNIWKNTGYGSIVYIAALTSISEDLYEAARVDGAGRWKQFLHITLPGLLPTIVVMLLVQLGGILNVGYEAIILLYNPGVYETADVINSYVYRSGIVEGRYDYATAVGLFNSVVALVLVLIANKVSNRLTETGLW